MTPPQAVLNWKFLATKYAQTHPILSTNEILAIIWTESWGNPKACNPNDPSYGLMQITMPIGRKFSTAQTPTDLYDPGINICAGAGFLAYLKDKYGVKYPNNAYIAMYNAGEPAVLKGFTDPDYIAAFVSHLAALNALG